MVAIDGDGVAALCCAHLLRQSEIPFFLSSASSFKQPAILIGTQAGSLLKEVCGREDLLQDGWAIERRVVLWGDKPEPVTVAHDGVAVPEERLIAGMSVGLTASSEVNGRGGWKIATRRSDPATEFLVCGERRAVSCRVKLKETEDSRSCWIESVADGWLFLLPYSESSASLIVAGDAETVLAESRLVAPRVEVTATMSQSASIAPRLARILHEEGTIFTGSAAMRFDPLCGEGAGHAVREAYLTVAVIRAAARGERVDDLLEHYSGRMRQAFLRHLAICASFYSTGGSTSFWRSELAAIEAGMQELGSMIAASAETQFRFRGLDLEHVAPHAPL